MNTFIVFVAVAIAAVAASDNYYGSFHPRGGRYNHDGRVAYFNDRSGNTVPVMGKDQNNDGVNDRYDSNRDGEKDAYAYSGHYAYPGYNAGYHGNSYGRNAYNNGYNRAYGFGAYKGNYYH